LGTSISPCQLRCSHPLAYTAREVGHVIAGGQRKYRAPSALNSYKKSDYILVND
jgi:hypothetical protein